MLFPKLVHILVRHSATVCACYLYIVAVYGDLVVAS
jgi:hypothetical protein